MYQYKGYSGVYYNLSV